MSRPVFNAVQTPIQDLEPVSGNLNSVVIVASGNRLDKLEIMVLLMVGTRYFHVCRISGLLWDIPRLLLSGYKGLGSEVSRMYG